MKKFDMAIIGSGIGGSLFAALNKDKNIILFEKDKNFGGCASTFCHKNYHFNAGATTFAGYEDGLIVKELFKQAKVQPKIKKTDIAYRVLQNGKSIDRVQDIDTYIEQIDAVFPNKNNKKFWYKIKEIDDTFWKIKDIFYLKYSVKNYIKTIQTGFKFFSYFKFDILKSADSFVKDILGDISKEYQDYLDATLLITVQKTSKNLPLIFFSLGLAYPFHDLYYANNGMGNIIDSLLENVNKKNNTEILLIENYNNGYKLHSKNEIFYTKKLILNSTMYDSGKLFSNQKIKNYYNSFEFHDQSAFVVYIKLSSEKHFLHHYQIILDAYIPNCTSNSFFVSISDKEDSLLSKDGYSLTISTHTKASIWKSFSKDTYKKQKKITQEYILKYLQKHLHLAQKDIKMSFSATSSTFNKYICRYNCGGTDSSIKNIFNNGGVTTPFKNLYNIGDTVMGSQGWPGVAMGVDILQKVIND